MDSLCSLVFLGKIDCMHFNFSKALEISRFFCQAKWIVYFDEYPNWIVYVDDSVSFWVKLIVCISISSQALSY